MKKIYSLLTLFVASLLGLAAQAETRTVTFHVDDASHLQPLEMYDSDVTISFGDDNTAQVTFGEEYGTRQVNINAADGCKIISVKKADGTEFKSYYTLWPNPSSESPATKVEFAAYDSYYGFDVEDGDVINIETIEVQSKIFTIKANPEHIKYAYVSGKRIYMDETGNLDIDVTDVYTLYVYFSDDGVYKSVTNETGETQDVDYSSYNNNISIRPGNYEGSQTFIINTASKESLRTASLSVSIENGKASDIDLYRGDKLVTLDDTESIIKFDPEGESAFKLSRNPWHEKLFQVKLDGEELSYSGSYINFNPKDGSKLVITVEAPVLDVDVPVAFDFTNPDTEGALAGLQVEGGDFYTAEQCLADGFTLKFGSKFSVKYNDSDYDATILYNGQYTTSGTIASEDEYVVTITATKIETKKITIKCAAWEHIRVADDWGNRIEISGEETIASFRSLPDYLKIYTYDKYDLNSVIDEATGEDILESDYKNEGKVRDLMDGMTIIINASIFEMVRDQEMVIFLENVEWKRQDFYVNNGDNVAQVYLDNGYNHIMFGTGDFEYADFSTMAPLVGQMVMYLNDEPVEMETNYWDDIVPVGLEKIKAGDVLKIFAEEKTPHQVTYQIADDVNAEVYHDHVVAVNEPSSHSVLPGTEIHIKPVASPARSASNSLIVKVNDQTISPAEDGVYTITADGDKTISVANDTSTSIAEICSDGSAKAYDLMGRKVNATHRGLTIINGKKVMK